GSVPSTETSPLSRRRYPSRISTVVVLPAPFGPSIANTSPWKISRSTPSTAIVSPYDLRSPLTRTLVVESMALASAGAGGQHNDGPAGSAVHHSVDGIRLRARRGSRQAGRRSRRRPRSALPRRGPGHPRPLRNGPKYHAGTPRPPPPRGRQTLGRVARPPAPRARHPSRRWPATPCRSG